MNIDIWTMGGYAAFVWPSVGLVVAVLVWNVWSARRHLQRARQHARRALAAKTAQQ